MPTVWSGSPKIGFYAFFFPWRAYQTINTVGTRFNFLWFLKVRLYCRKNTNSIQNSWALLFMSGENFTMKANENLQTHSFIFYSVLIDRLHMITPRITFSMAKDLSTWWPNYHHYNLLVKLHVYNIQFNLKIEYYCLSVFQPV